VSNHNLLYTDQLGYLVNIILSALPMTIIPFTVGLFLRLSVIANRHRKQIAAIANRVRTTEAQLPRDRGLIKSAKVLLFIVGSYLIFWFPPSKLPSAHKEFLETNVK